MSFRALFFCGAVLISVAGTCRAEPKLYALLVFDTNAENIGRSIEKDRTNIMRILYKAFDKDERRHQVEWHILDGDRVSRDRILKYYADLETDGDDIIFFYYSGHGTRDDDGEQYLATSGGRLKRSLLRGAINFQKKRMAIMVTDSCASTLDDKNVKPLEPRDINALVDEEGANWLTVKQLFFSGSGLVDVNSSKPKQSSYTNSRVGGYFTSAFTYELCRKPDHFDDDGDVTWSKFLGHVDGEIESNYISKEIQFSHVWYMNRWPEQRWEKKLLIHNGATKWLRVHVSYYTKTTGGWDWVSPSGTWKFAPGEETYLSDPPPQDFVARGRYFRIWAESLDGKFEWTTHKQKNFEALDDRFGYANDHYENVRFDFSD